MQKKPSAARIGSAVERVARNRMPNAGQMNPNLVRPPGPDLNLHVRVPWEPLQNSIRCYCGTAGPEPGRHAGPSHRIPRDRRFYGSFRRGNRSLHQGQVCLIDFPEGELLCQFAVRNICSGDQENAARVFIDAMNDSGPLFASNTA